MISIAQAIILGLIQGITEWLPLSSSGHLVMAQVFFGIGAPIVFSLWLHIATLLIIFGFFKKELASIFKSFIYWDYKSKEFKLGAFILISNIPILIVGFFFRNFIKQAFSSLFAVGLGLLFTSLLLFFSDKQNVSRPVGPLSAFVVGIFQALAVFPGVSRSGTTIGSALLQGISREEAVRFSFLLAIPAFLGATVLEMKSLTLEVFSVPYVVGFLTAFVVGYFALKLLLRLITARKFHYFAYYCLALGLILITFF